MGFVVPLLAGLLFLGLIGLIEWRIVIGLTVGGGIAAATGFIDDHGDVPVRWRLLGHFGAAAFLMWSLGGFPPVSILGWTIILGWPGYLLGAVFLVWMINLTNFMDGIDGLAGVEAVTAAVGGAMLALTAGAHLTVVTPPLLLASATAGFLVWNWPPAKIFMGDVGSGFLGIVLGGLHLYAALFEPSFLWSWLILLGAFITDATTTLIRRILQGGRFYEAHRSHAYQHAVDRLENHGTVTVAVGAINLLWLLPWAVLVGLGMVPDLLGVLIAFTPLVWLAFHFRAGHGSAP